MAELRSRRCRAAKPLADVVPAMAAEPVMKLNASAMVHALSHLSDR
jgi:hypothetical protein